MHRFLGLAVVLCTLVCVPTTHAQAPPDTYASGDVTHITSDTTWTGTHVVDVLHIAAPATLTLRGVQLSVGQRIVVDSGASLVAGPADSTPTRILPRWTGAATTANGFWMAVNGTLTTSGVPATEISGVRGSGLNSMYFAGGGIHVRGDASLADLWLHDGAGPLAVDQGGRILLDHVRIDRMGFLAVGVLGPLQMRNSTITGSDYALMGKTVCDFDIAASRLQATSGEPIMDNGCPLRLRDSLLEGGAANGLYVAGAANATLRNVTLRGFGANGITALRLGSGPQAPRPRLSLDGVTIDGASAAPPLAAGQRRLGLQLEGGEATLRATRVAGNSVGVAATNGALLDAQDSVFEDNLLAGVAAQGARLKGDVLGPNRFVGNGVPVAVQTQARVVVLGPDGGARPHVHLEVFAANGSRLLDVDGGTAGFAQGSFLPYAVGPDRSASFSGPFHYRVSEAGLGTREGALDLASPSLVLADTHVPASSGSRMDWTALAVVAGVACLLLAGRWRRQPSGRADQSTPEP